MDIPTIPGAVYTISSASSCDVTDKASGQLLGTATAGAPFTTPAYSDALTLSAPDALYVQLKNFNYALAALGLLGGGASSPALPPGYLAAEFLESTGTQYVKTDVPASGDLSVLGTYELTINGCVYGSRTGSDTWSPYNANYVHFSSSQGITFGYWYIYTSLGAFEANKKSIFKATNSLEIDGNIVTEKEKADFTGLPLFVFSCNTLGNQTLPFSGKIYNLSIESKTHKVVFVAALDPQGIPCMYDKVSKQPFYNSGTGSFIVGFTLAQARQLGNLPATGGTLTISLPSNWQEDDGVVNALATAEANGWVFTYQTYEAASTVSTFALRRIFVRKTQNENGQYIDADGTRWHVEWCAGMIGAEPTDHGYEPFRSVDAAVSYWELFPWVDPESEEMMQNEFLTNSTTP